MRAIITAVVLVLGSVALVTSASAQRWGEHRGGEFREHRGIEFREHRGFEGRRFEGGEHERRFWHGRWYPYGVGSCWRWTPVGYVWVCG